MNNAQTNSTPHAAAPCRRCLPLGGMLIYALGCLVGASGCTRVVTERSFLEHRTLVAAPVPLVEVDAPPVEALTRR